jgi:diguanylate cyclase (GGDEF)-like protein
MTAGGVNGEQPKAAISEQLAKAAEETVAQPRSQRRPLSYLKEEYRPIREDAERVLLESGITKDMPQFPKARKNVARELIKKREEGEIDVLTNLPNRRGFLRRYDQEVSRAKRSHKNLEIIFLDTNALKQWNDLPESEGGGHDVGDVYLQLIAKILREHARDFDIVARYGGDEFAVVIVNENKTEARAYWQRILPLLEKQGLGVSAGACKVDLRHNPHSSIGKADDLMYKAKEISRESGKSEIMFEEYG